MSGTERLQEGMEVYEGDRAIGRIERLHGDGFHVAGQHYDRSNIARVAQNKVYLRGTGAAQGTARTMESGAMAGAVDNEREVRVPVVEEELQVGKREVELGEVEVRRRVVEEERSVPVTLRQEEVRIEQVGTPERPLRAGEEAFQEGTIRVPVRGEEAVVSKEAVVTGEVVIEKEVTEEQREVSDTVRRTEVDFDENYKKARSGLQQQHATTASTTGRTFEQAEPQYRSGFMAGSDERYAGREFEDVEPEMRRQYETTSTSTRGSGDTWEHLREEIRTGFHHARNSTR